MCAQESRSDVTAATQVELTMREAIRLGIADEMRADPTVVVFGEDVADAGGVFKVTAGLVEEFGRSRVRDTPISETAILGAAVGAAARGLRPVVEIMFAEFFGVALDQIATQAAKMLYLSAGRIPIPIVVRTSAGGGLGFGAQHSQTLESWFMNQPGLVVVSPADASSAYGLMRSAIRDNDPVIFIEPRRLYGTRSKVTAGEEGVIPLRTAAVVCRGDAVTIAALGQMTSLALAAAEQLEDEIDCEVIDLRTIRPWDRGTVVESVAKTGRLLILEENPLTGGWGADVAATISAECMSRLRAPVLRVSAPDVPVPFSPQLEAAYLPSIDDVVVAARGLVQSDGAHSPRWSTWKAVSTMAAGADPREQIARRRALLTPVGRLERLYEIRTLEDRVLQLFSEGLVAGSTHTCQGQEAISVGIAATTEPEDVVTCTYRGHGTALALGMTPLEVVGEILGRQAGCLRGKGGSMHLCAPEIGLLPTFAIVGAGIPVAVGAALAAQVEGRGVAVAVFGDGATNIGAFHEALNLAAVWKLPAVFVIENNLYGEYSRIERTTPVSNLAVRAASYAMPSEIVDGQDLDAVMSAMARAVARARAEDGPTLLEMKTYRYSGHSRGDAAKYRPTAEVDQWRTRDPLDLYARELVTRGEIDDRTAQELRAVVEANVEKAIEAAKASPPADIGEILNDVTTVQLTAARDSARRDD